MIGRTISHYKIVDKLGEGGMGSVWKAEDTTLNRLVAIKSLSQHLAENEEARERFVREAQAASALNHANITTVYDLLEDEGEQYIAMEYVEGKTIRDIVESGHVSIRKALDFIIQATEALHAAHNKGILHRDIKSANIMVSMEGNVKVMDFGLAHLEERSQLTRTGTTMGTLAYSSPEQLTGALVDRKSEVFSLGCVFYELLTGSLPFKSPSEGELVFEIINTEQDRPSKLRDDVPEKVDAVIDRMLVKKPELRYESCGELLTDLKAIRSELETTVAIAQVRPSLKAQLKKPVTLGVMAVVAIALLILVITSGRAGTNLDSHQVLVTVFDNETQDASFDDWGVYIASYLITSIDRSKLMDTVPYDHVRIASQMLREQALRGELDNPILTQAEQTSSGYVVSGSYFQLDDGQLEFHVRIQNTRNGREIGGIGPITGSVEEREQLLELIRQRVLAVLAHKCDPAFASYAQITDQPNSFDALLQYNAGLDLYLEGGYDNTAAAIPYMYRSIELDSTYVAPRRWAARLHYIVAQSGSVPRQAAYLHRDRADSIITSFEPIRHTLSPLEQHFIDLVKGGIEEDLEARYRAAYAGHLIAPGTIWSYYAAMHAHWSNRPKLSLSIFEELDPDGPAMRGAPQYWSQKGFALELDEQYTAVLENADVARHRIGETNDMLDRSEIRALAALGRFDDIIGVIERIQRDEMNPWSSINQALTSLRAHGHTEAALRMSDIALDWLASRSEEEKRSLRHRARMAFVLYRAEQWEESRLTYENLIGEDPSHNLVLACIAARQGNREEALHRLDLGEEVYRNRKYNFGVVEWYRARVFAQLGELETAIQYLSQAMRYYHVYSIKNQWDLQPLHGHSEYETLIAPKG